MSLEGTQISSIVSRGRWLRLARTFPSSWNRASRKGVGEDLQGNVAAELRVGSATHLVHAPLADEGGHVVPAEAVTDGEGHTRLPSGLCLALLRTRPAHDEREAPIALVARIFK